jgi:hypothetical protein
VKRLFAVLAMVGVLAGCAPVDAQPTSTTGSGSAITAELGKVKVVASRPDVPGYKRAQFGKAWADTDHNGCDTRNDMLKAQLTAVELRDGSSCVVVAGQLADPYTGRTIVFRKAQATAVQIDHRYPLSLAWDMGAAGWTVQRRTDFANDESVNLLAVDGKANESKGDSGLSEWLPINKAYRCTYVLLYLQVAVKYGLPVTKADADTARTIAPTCGGAR